MNANDDSSPPSDGAMRTVGAIVAVLASCVAAFSAVVADAILSTEDYGSHQIPLLIAQLIVGLVGLLPAGLFARALVRRRDSQAVLWLCIGLVVYVGWGVLNDAAVHGWANLKVF